MHLLSSQAKSFEIAFLDCVPTCLKCAWSTVTEELTRRTIMHPDALGVERAAVEEGEIVRANRGVGPFDRRNLPNPRPLTALAALAQHQVARAHILRQAPASGSREHFMCGGQTEVVPSVKVRVRSPPHRFALSRDLRHSIRPLAPPPFLPLAEAQQPLSMRLFRPLPPAIWFLGVFSRRNLVVFMAIYMGLPGA